MLEQMTARLDAYGQSLMLRSHRQQVIASNIANADTPGYQAREIDFAKTLRAATERGAAPAATLVATSERHLGPTPGSTVGAAPLIWATPSQTSLDGNSVDMDRERASFADNALKYEASLRFLNGSLRTMLDAIKGQ